MTKFVYVCTAFLWLEFCLAASPGRALAQNTNSVRGTVTDEKGEVLAGVSVLIKGTQNGTATNAEGKFLINVSQNNATLIFSSVGYQNREIAVSSAKDLTVALTRVAGALDEVVVVGYGSVKKPELTSSVGQVSMKDLQKAPVTSFDQALAGRVAGVQVNSTDGQPGALINIIIRGQNSVTQDNSPLYVVDGFPIEGNDNNAINPADIESINILKDASATAIYGARGANGVIVITTKRGVAGEPVISYNGYFGFQKNTKRIALLSPYEFVKLQMEISSVNATTAYLSPIMTLDDYKNEAGIDWVDKTFHTAPYQSHNLSVSGGTAKGRYSISSSMDNQEGILFNSGFKRYQGRITLDQNINSKLKLGINANYAASRNYGTIVKDNQGLPSISFMYGAWSYRPVQNIGALADIEDILFDPELNHGTDRRTNPLIQAQNELRQANTNNILGNAYIEYTILKGLKLRLTGGISNVLITNLAFNNSLTRLGNPDYPENLGVNGTRIVSEATNYSNENTLSYNYRFNNDHSFDVVAGYSQQKNYSKSNGLQAVQLPNESLGLNGLDEGTPRTVTATGSTWALQSLYARANYFYKNKFILNGSIRTDGSSKFVGDNRWGVFEAGSAAYRFSEENFIKKLKFITDGKIRASYGVTGNNRVGDFASLSAVTFGNSITYSFGNGVPVRGAATTQLGNPTLKWETTGQFDVGLDLVFWGERFSFTGDYYNKVTDNLLLNAQLPSLTGYSAAFKNIGKVSNSGIELAFNSINITNDKFSWSTNFNISFNRNKVLALTQNQEAITSVTGGVFGSTPKYIAKLRQPIAQFYGVLQDGLYQYADFDVQTNGTYVLKENIATNGAARANIKPGDVKTRDLNGDGVVNTADFTVIGNPNPDFTGGFSNNFTYRGFDLNIFFQYSYGNDVFNANRVTFEGGMTLPANTNMYATFANRWTPTNTNTDINRLGGNDGIEYQTNRVIEDGSFLRLKTVSFGYNLPEKLLKFAHIKSLRVYTSAQNLYTWTNYTGLDPEVSIQYTNLTPGYDYSAYPRAKTIIFGLNATF
jgi:TonB-linked SusC/RagA family outer membrane protein